VLARTNFSKVRETMSAATTATPRILDAFNAAEEQAQVEEREAVARRTGLDNRALRLIEAARPAQEYTLSPPAGNGPRAVAPVENWFYHSDHHSFQFPLPHEVECGPLHGGL
jgi:hypothetical protein